MNTASKRFAEIRLKDKAQFEVDITAKLVENFAKLSGDYNPLHTDARYAKTTSFGETIPHGMIAGALFSRLIGMYLPGERSLYLSQTLFFRKPMRVGMEAIISGEVTHLTHAQHTVVVATTLCNKKNGDVLVDGEAMVKIV